MVPSITFADPSASTSKPGLHVRQEAPSSRHPNGRTVVWFTRPNRPAKPSRLHRDKTLEIPSLAEVEAAPFDFFGAEDDRLRWASSCKRVLVQWTVELAQAASCPA